VRVSEPKGKILNGCVSVVVLALMTNIRSLLPCVLLYICKQTSRAGSTKFPTFCLTAPYPSPHSADLDYRLLLRPLHVFHSTEKSITTFASLSRVSEAVSIK
jgi:hypothetical protein